MAVADDIDERPKDVEAGIQDAVVLAEALHDERTLLRHDDRGSRQYDQDETIARTIATTSAGPMCLLSLQFDRSALALGAADKDR